MSIEWCSTCVNSIRCNTWAEWKCIVKERRFTEPSQVAECDRYKKRGKDFKERKCQCEDCLRNDSLSEEYLEADA